MTISYIIWNGSPEIFSIGSFALRWYGLLFASGFLVSQQILYYIYRKEGKPEKDVDILTVYMLIATVAGARLGHVIFYQPEMLWNNPMEVFLPFEFTPSFHFTGYQGLASHGGAIGILFALWVYANYSITFSKTDMSMEEKPDEFGTIKKKIKRGLFITRRVKPGQSYLQVLDRIVIVVAITGAFIRLGNFFNSEIIGKPSNAPQSMIFLNRLTEDIKTDRSYKFVESLKIVRDDSLPDGAHGRVPIVMYFFFKPGTQEQDARSFLVNDVKFFMNRLSEWIDEPTNQPLRYELAKEQSGTYAARVRTFGIARHPAQLYECISCVVLFFFLFWLWSRRKAETPAGRIFGVFLIVLWSLRFAYEYLKENQVNFENTMTLNMGQILSIPLVIVGIFVLVRSYRQDPTSPATGTS